MNKRLLLCTCWVLSLACHPSVSPALSAAPAQAARPVNPPKLEVKPAAPEAVVTASIFTDDPLTGRDPFFPASDRRIRQQRLSTAAQKIAEPSSLLSQLSIKGMSGVRNRRLALINNVTFAAGEQAELRIGNQMIKVRCHEIRDRSAFVSIEGSKEIRELKLRDGL